MNKTLVIAVLALLVGIADLGLILMPITNSITNTYTQSKLDYYEMAIVDLCGPFGYKVYITRVDAYEYNSTLISHVMSELQKQTYNATTLEDFEKMLINSYSEEEYTQYSVSITRLPDTLYIEFSSGNSYVSPTFYKLS
jgi:hypothetical protein